VRILVVNAGSSSLKLRLLGGGDELLADAELPAPRARVDEPALAAWVRTAGRVDVVAHRIVHGGERFREAVPVDASVVRALHELTDLAPLHQPKSLAALDAVQRMLPDVPSVACFDTAFHATIDPAAATYAVPSAWNERWGVRRYGFHGLSHAYASRRAHELTGARRVVTCHLGAGASLAAVRDGRSVDTTMGFTPLEGLVMATRSGSVDPGLLLWLLERERVTVSDMAQALEHESGILALAGTADMREVLDRRDPAAFGAVAVYVHRLRAGVAAMAAATGGLDAIVFTGGVGENAAAIRAQAAAGLAFLGVGVDPRRNTPAADTPPDRDVTAAGARVRALVIRAREDLEMARQVRALLGDRHAGRGERPAVQASDA
jgi:acetate kinase